MYMYYCAAGAKGQQNTRPHIGVRRDNDDIGSLDGKGLMGNVSNNQRVDHFLLVANKYIS